MKNNSNLRVSHRYTRLPDISFNLFASSAVVALDGNPAFANPLVPVAELSALQADFGQKLTASNLGGRMAKAAKNEARAALTDGLRREGIFVQSVTHNLSTLLSSGYLAASQNRAQTPLLTPAIRKMLNEASRQLVLRVTPIANARNYQVQIQIGDGAWQEAGIYSMARRMVLTGLTPGTVYNVRVRALGGSTGQSDWSNVTSRMAI